MIKLKKLLAEQSNNIDMAATAAQNVQLKKQRDDFYWNKLSDSEKVKFTRMKEKYYNPEVLERTLSDMGWIMDRKSALDDDGLVTFNHRNKKETIPIIWHTAIYDEIENLNLNPDMPGPLKFSTLDDDFVTFNGKNYDLVKGNEEELVYKLARLSIKAAKSPDPYYGIPKDQIVGKDGNPLQ